MTDKLTTTQKKTAVSYGGWPSLISSQLILSDSISIDEPKQTEKSILYIERRPREGGRCVIVKVIDDVAHDILPAPFSARSRVHEYGGGSYCVAEDLIYFVNDSDQEIYCINNGQVKRLTTTENKRFADISYDRKHLRLIAICETLVNHIITMWSQIRSSASM